MAAHVRGTIATGSGPLPGVAVSDGRSVTSSGADGGFELRTRGRFVFLCVPTGYATDAWFLPADGELRFELRPQNQPSSFTFLQISDLHLAVSGQILGGPPATTPAVLAALLDRIAEDHTQAAFVVSTGDQTNDGTDDEYEAYLSAVNASPLRVIAIPGNHDHNSVDISEARTEGERFGPGVFYTPYDRFMGPRWFSFEYGGVHFVAVDWTTHHLGFETDVQEEWVAADLALVAPETPVVFLTHDLMSSDFFSKTGRIPVASFSGHWHTSRTVEANGTLHVNTAPATFGGLDYSPAHYRIVDWDGESISVSTVSLRTDRDTKGSIAERSLPSSVWSSRLENAAHRAGPVVVDDLIVAASSCEELPAGSLEGFDSATGERRWAVRLGSGIKATPVVIGRRIVATAVTGESVCVEATTGVELWRTEIDDPLRLWTYLRPATDRRRVFVGDTARFVALDLDDGSVVWSRDDLGVRGNITCHAHPAVVDGTVVVAFSAQVPDMWALDAATGATKWPAEAVRDSVYNLSPEEMAVHLPRTCVSGFATDPDEPHVYVARLGNRLDRVLVEDGEVIWSAALDGHFNPATPVVDGDDLFVCEGAGSVRCLSREDGSLRWHRAVTTDGPLSMGPYRAGGGALFGEPVLHDGHLTVACGDGRLVTMSRAEGAIVHDVDLGVPFAAAPAISGQMIFVLGVDGTLFALPLPA